MLSSAQHHRRGSAVKPTWCANSRGGNPYLSENPLHFVLATTSWSDVFFIGSRWELAHIPTTNKKTTDFSVGCYESGKEGIRTPETLLTFTRFPGGPVQPLLHLSFLRSAKIEYIFDKYNFLS